MINYLNRIIVSLFCLICFSAFGQKQVAFSTTPHIFISQLDTFLRQTPNKHAIEQTETLIVALKQNLIQGNWSDSEWQKVIEMALQMQAARLKNHPQFYNYFFTLNQLNASNQSHESLMEWNSFLLKLLNNKSIKEFEKIVQQTNQLLLSEKLFSKGTTHWYLRNAKFSFVADTSLYLLVERANLVCATTRDSSVIKQTQGRYNFSNQLWMGNSGRVDWKRFHFDSDKVFVELSTHTIDLNGSSFAADSAVFRNTEYFNFPVLGRFQDHVLNSPPSDLSTHPRFTSYLFDYDIPNIFQAVNYNGGIAMEGSRFIGKASETHKASLKFIKDKTVAVAIRSSTFILNKSRISSEKVSATIYLDTDSIYHPNVWFRYNEPTRLLTISRSERGATDGPFYNSYHGLDIYVESIYWFIDQSELQFKQLESLNPKSNGWVESANYFNEGEFKKMQGIDDAHPLHAIDNYVKKFATGNVLRVSYLSEFLKKPPEQIIAQLVRLGSKGYVIYDPETQTAQLTKRFFSAVLISTGKSDFDLIRIYTTTEAKLPNLQLNVKTFDLKMYGITEVVLSEAQRVQLFPGNSEIVFKRNRDFTFHGLVKAGLFTFYAREASFEYNTFKLNFSFVDSISFVVKSREHQSKSAKPEYVRVKNTIADNTGTLFIDNPDNKSGLKKIARFPVYSSKSESYVYFDKPEIQSGKLDRKRFYYVIDPFEIDSLNSFSTDNLRFKGYLTSADIFPVFREPLAVMKDYSLGFNHKTSDAGYQMFNGKAKYQNNIHLSNTGFTGAGRLDYLTTNATSEAFVFFPDSVVGLVDRFVMKERENAVEFPAGFGTQINFNWATDTNILVLTTLKNTFQIFSNATFAGILEVSPTGMKANGELQFGKAQLQSKWFNLLSKSFTADTADFRLFPEKGLREAFMANDYKAFIDFRNNIGNFKYINKKSKLSFPFNQYYCTLDEANWYIDKNRIALNNNRIDRIFDFKNISLNELLDLNLSGSEFVSEHPKQDSLSFFSLTADYDLNDYAIHARNVKIMRVADAAIFPTDGVVTILKDAEMKPLENATIVANTKSRLHKITDAKVAVVGRKNYKASGKYQYYNFLNEATIFKLNEIGVDSSGKTYAKALISPAQPLLLNPWFGFSGEITINAHEKQLHFSGGYNIIHSCYDNEKPWVSFNASIDPMQVILPVKNKNVDIKGAKLSNGLYYSNLTDSYYAGIMQLPKSTSDKEIASIDGTLSFDSTSESYLITAASQNKIKPFMRLNTKQCIVEGSAELDFDFRLPAVELKTIGSYAYKAIPDSIYFDLFASLNFFFDEKLLSILADSLNASNLKGTSLVTGSYPLAVSTMLGAQESEKLLNEIRLYGTARKVPEQLQKTLVINSIKMKWNPPTKSFVSYGPIGIANINKTQVNKLVEGFFEIEKSRSGDGFSLYLMLSSKKWFFFSYKGGVMQALSSSELFNTELMKIKEEKRVKNNPAEGGRYEYIISTRRKMVDFLRKMQSVEF